METNAKVMDDYFINKNRELSDSMNYDKLRKLGMEYISRISGSLWTDHNLHDPGVTTLELLCYALTDLGYRTSFDMKDILTPKGCTNFKMEDHFIRAEEILPSHPLTINDYRKLILEHFPFISNVFLRPVEKSYELSDFMLKNYWNGRNENKVKCNGYYHVLFNLSPEVYREFKMSENEIEQVYSKLIGDFLAEHRNLCEDFEDIVPTKKIGIGIEARIDVTEDADNTKIRNEICKKLDDYINLRIPRSTFAEMLEKGKTIDQIFQGLPAGSLFVDEEDLIKNKSNRVTLYLSDIVNIIMSVDGVINIQRLYFVTSDEGKQKGKSKLSLSHSACYDDAVFSFDYKLLKILFCSESKEEELLPGKYIGKKITTDNDFLPCLDIPQGEYRDTEEYISFQNEFPALYRLGKGQLDDNASKEQKAAVMQFKGYLVFFDQLLADYLAQLSSIKYLYSWQDHSDDFKQDKSDTYFYNELNENEISCLKKLKIDYSSYNYYQESNKVKYNRKGRFLDNLIARFNEQFVNFSINEYREKSYSRFKGKRRFLDSYARISIRRTHAFNLSSVPGNNNRNIVEDRIRSKLGINTTWYKTVLTPIYCKNENKITFLDNRNKDLSKNFGVHIYEHSTLFPKLDRAGRVSEKFFIHLRNSRNSSELLKNPYSMYVTAVVPGWLNCSTDIKFRKYVENLIREEIPAHVMLRICWVDPYQMMQLEETYEEYITKKANGEQGKSFDKVFIKLVELFSSLRNMYPYFRLHNPLHDEELRCSILCEGILGGDIKDTTMWEFAQK